MGKSSRFRALLFAALLISATVTAASAANLRAGVAKVDITPPRGAFPLEAGQIYGSVHDPLYVRALVLDNGTDKVALISVDSADLGKGNGLIEAVTQELGIPRTHLILNATHDHNSPSPGANARSQQSWLEYVAVLKRGVVEAAHLANARLQAARIGFGTGMAYVNTNRDEKIGDGYHMGYAPEGPSDKTVAVMLVTTSSGDPIAVYANYAVHGVVMYRAHTLDGQVQISADLPGATANYVEAHLKNAVMLWSMGAAGDQNPLFMANYNQDAPDVIDEGAAGWAILDVLARRLGEEIVRVATHVQDTSDQVVLWGASTSVNCPGQQRAQPPDPGAPPGGYLAPAHVAMVAGDPVTIPLSLLMINDIAVAGVSGEVFTEIGEHLKRESIFGRTLLVTMLPPGIGYIPSDRAYLLPSEKALTNRLKPGCAEPALIGAFHDLMTQYLPIWKASH